MPQNRKIAKSQNRPSGLVQGQPAAKSQNLKIAKSQNRFCGLPVPRPTAKSQNRKIAKSQNRKIYNRQVGGSQSCSSPQPPTHTGRQHCLRPPALAT